MDLLNDVLITANSRKNLLKRLELEIKHKLLLSITEPSFIPEDPPINVNIHFLKFKKSKTERDRWNIIFYMYSSDRGVDYRMDGHIYPEISQKLYELIQEMARMDEIFRAINN